VSQICFDPQVTADWMRSVWERGTRLPIHIGLPGATSSAKLLRVCERIRVGDSVRMLRADGATLNGDFDPGPLVSGLDESLGKTRPNLGGFHIFTFNDLAQTERWRRRQLGS
jgi:methylenetetrahydrofolate reductase (NADPH)